MKDGMARSVSYEKADVDGKVTAHLIYNKDLFSIFPLSDFNCCEALD